MWVRQRIYQAKSLRKTFLIKISSKGICRIFMISKKRLQNRKFNLPISQRATQSAWPVLIVNRSARWDTAKTKREAEKRNCRWDEFLTRVAQSLISAAGSKAKGSVLFWWFDLSEIKLGDHSSPGLLNNAAQRRHTTRSWSNVAPMEVSALLASAESLPRCATWRFVIAFDAFSAFGKDFLMIKDTITILYTRLLNCKDSCFYK